MKKRALKDKVIDLQKQLTELKGLHTALGNAYEIKIKTCQLLRTTNIDLQNRIKELEVQNIGLVEELQYLKPTPKEFETDKPTLGEALLGVESEPTFDSIFKGITIPIGIYPKHGKEIESLISTLERCKSERKRFEYRLEFFGSSFHFIINYFEKEVFRGIYPYSKIEILISELTTLFLSEKVSEELLDLIFERVEHKNIKSTSWFSKYGLRYCEISIKEYEDLFRWRIIHNYDYFTTISELEVILIENEISL